MTDNNSLHRKKIQVLFSLDFDQVILIHQRHIYMYTVLYFSRKLLHLKKKSNNLVSNFLILANKIIYLCHQDYSVDFSTSRRPLCLVPRGVAYKTVDCIIFVYKVGLKVIHEVLTEVTEYHLPLCNTTCMLYIVSELSGLSRIWETE